VYQGALNTESAAGFPLSFPGELFDACEKFVIWEPNSYMFASGNGSKVRRPRAEQAFFKPFWLAIWKEKDRHIQQQHGNL